MLGSHVCTFLGDGISVAMLIGLTLGPVWAMDRRNQIRRRYARGNRHPAAAFSHVRKVAR